MRKHRTTCNEVAFRTDADNADAELRATCEAWLHYCVARFIDQREGNANNKYFTSIFFSNDPCRKCCVRTAITNDQCGKMIVRGTMDVGINNIIYMELHLGPKMANGTCGKTIVVGTIDRGSTVIIKCTVHYIVHLPCIFSFSCTYESKGFWRFSLILKRRLSNEKIQYLYCTVSCTVSRDERTIKNHAFPSKRCTSNEKTCYYYTFYNENHTYVPVHNL